MRHWHDVEVAIANSVCVQGCDFNLLGLSLPGKFHPYCAIYNRCRVFYFSILEKAIAFAGELMESPYVAKGLFLYLELWPSTFAPPTVQEASLDDLYYFFPIVMKKDLAVVGGVFFKEEAT